MAKVPIPIPRPTTFDERFDIPTRPQFRTGTMEAAKETLANMLNAQPRELEQFIAQMDKEQRLRDFLNQPFPQTYEPENMPKAVGPQGIDPVEMPEVPDPSVEKGAYGHFKPDGGNARELSDEEMAILENPAPKYSRIGFPEAVNPFTFMQRYSEAMQPNFEQRYQQRIPPIDNKVPEPDVADEMVKNEIDKQAD